eukprot:1227400-Prymnesium_polylepis.1
MEPSPSPHASQLDRLISRTHEEHHHHHRQHAFIPMRQVRRGAQEGTHLPRLAAAVCGRGGHPANFLPVAPSIKHL